MLLLSAYKSMIKITLFLSAHQRILTITSLGLKPRQGAFVAQLGEELTIPCIYEGSPAASSITWKQDATQLSTTTSQQLDLVLGSVTKTQNGEYTCVIVAGGDSLERVVELNVLSKSIVKPSFLTHCYCGFSFIMKLVCDPI